MNKAVMEVESKQDGWNPWFGGGGFTDDAADDGLCIGAGIGIEANLEAL